MLICARRTLAASLLGDTTTFAGSPGPCGRLPGDFTNRAQGPGLPAEEPALLLEGSWPDAEARPNRWSLDDAIDARFAWIDLWAANRAEQLGRPNADFAGGDHPTLAYLNELALRYFLVKLLRVVAFFDELCLPAPGETWQLYLAEENDAVYAELFGALAERHGVELAVHWHGSLGPRGRLFGRSTSRAQGPGLPFKDHGLSQAGSSSLNGRRSNLAVQSATFAERNAGPSWRRWAGRAATFLSRISVSRSEKCPHVILCGNPRVLDPVCAELLARGCRVWWLYEQLAVRAWWKWRRAGLAQLLCDDTRTVRSLPISHAVEVVCRGVRLDGAIACWLSEQAAAHGVRQAGWLKQIDEHFEAVQPTSLVLDEDATPFKRVAVAMARRHGVGSLVVQHGAPCGPFGFAPLAADEICVWGESPRRQLLDWGVDDAKIHLTGWPSHALSAHCAASLSAKSGATRMRSSRNATEDVPYRRRWAIVSSKFNHRQPSLPPHSPRFLLLATVPPDDSRPDTVTFHLTSRNHIAMLEMACAAISNFAGARLTIKLHPRTPDAGVFESLAERWPHLDIRMVRNRDAASLFADADCVLSCASTAGIEAALAGAPVVQLLPEGSGNVLAADRWGLIGSAHTLAELLPLISQALARGWVAAPERSRDIIAATGLQACAAIADRVLITDPLRVAEAEACRIAGTDSSAVAMIP